MFIGVPTFSISDPSRIIVWLADLISCISVYKNYNCKHLYVDVRGNTGGVVVLGSVLSLFLFPNEHPSSSKLEALNTPMSRARLESLSTEAPMDYETMEAIDLLSLPTYNKTFSGFDQTRSREWLGYFALSPYTYQQQLKALLPPNLLKGYYISPHEVIMITDGRCGSTCSQFIKRISEQHLAKVVGLGGNLLSDDPHENFDISTYAAGSVYDSKSASSLSFEGHPPEFARDTTKITFALMNGKSFDWKTKDQDLEFKIIAPDSIYSYYTSPGNSAKSDPSPYENLFTDSFDKCFKWEVKQSECTPSPEDHREHALYGYPCNSETGQFDTSKCSFARCEDGYYLNEHDQCVERPSGKVVPCGFGQGQIFDPSEIEDCINGIPFDPSDAEISTLIPTILKHFEGYAYRDTYLNPPKYHEAQTMDIVAKLRAIKPEAYTNTYDFYADIDDVIISMKDAHTTFIGPCFNLFSYLFPYQLVVDTTEDSPPQLQVKLHEHPVSQATSYYETSNDANLTGCTVTHLKLGDIENVEGEKPIITLGRWSEKFVSVSRNPAGRFSYALAEEFHIRPVSRYRKPEPVELSYTCDSGTQGTKSIPFYGFSSVQISHPEQYCSKYPFTPTNDSSSMTELDSAPLIPEQKDIKQLSQNFTIEESDLSQDPLEYKHPYFASRIRAGRNRITRLYEEKYSQLAANTTFRNQSNSAPEFTVIKKSKAFVGGIVEEWDIGFLDLSTFSTDSIKNTLQEFGEYCAELKRRNIKNLIIDVRGNTGG